MVGAEHVDRSVEPPVELVLEVRDVGRAVRGQTALLRRADDHLVLVVAELARAHPDSPFMLVGRKAREQFRDALLQLALQRPGVEMDPEPLEGGLDAFEHRCHGIAACLGQLGDVVPEVAALRRLFTAAPRLDGLAELVHLGARVVVVVLARHVVPGVLEEPGHRVAVRPIPCRGNSDRPRRVRRDHLDLHPLGLVRETRSVAIARVEDLAQRFPVPGRREPEVDEARARDLGALDALQRLRLGDQLLRDLAGRLACAPARAGVPRSSRSPRGRCSPAARARPRARAPGAPGPQPAMALP